MKVRINRVAPDRILTDRAWEELARTTPGERAAMPAPRPPWELADGVVGFVRNGAFAVWVMVMWPG